MSDQRDDWGAGVRHAPAIFFLLPTRSPIFRQKEEGSDCCKKEIELQTRCCWPLIIRQLRGGREEWIVNNGGQVVRRISRNAWMPVTGVRLEFSRFFSPSPKD